MIRLKNIALIWAVLLNGNLFAQTFVLPDSGFKACLAEKYSSLLDANKELIVANAQAHTGFLSCIGAEIKSIDGFQYFKNVKNVNFSRNSITTINEWPVNDSLTRLVLDDNQLTSLTSLEKLPNLKTITLKRNQLTALPDLSSNTKITQLYVQGNALTSLPHVSTLTELWAFDVSDNQLTSLPPLSASSKLVELKASNNKLTEIPSLVNLNQLARVDFSQNQLTIFPQFATVNKITILDFEWNKFTELPDFTVFPNLVTAFFNDNYLTFNDLQSLTSFVNYETTFKLNSQHDLSVGGTYSVEELKTLYLKTGVDLGVSGVAYRWYFNGDLVQQSTSDSLLVFTDSVSLSGTYYCELIQPAFSNLVLKTTNFNVTVLPCFINNDFSIEVEPRNCEQNEGKIQVASNQLLPPGFRYQLTSSRTAEAVESKSGYFNGLMENKYVLKGVVGACEKYIDKVKVGEEDCLNVHISADGDGVNDTYYFNEVGEVTIQDKFGNTVAELQIPTTWDGGGKSGKVASGLYYADINQGEKLVKITVVY